MKTLYILKSGNYIKIGICANLEKRKKQYATHNPEFEIVCTREGTPSDEYFLHKIFEKYLHHGEWYIYNQEIINKFKTIHLNHKEPTKKKSKKQVKHIQEIIHKRKVVKESPAWIIRKDGTKERYIPK